MTNKEARCALTYLLTYMGDGSIISAIAVPPCSEPVPLRIFWSGYRPARYISGEVSTFQ